MSFEDERINPIAPDISVDKMKFLEWAALRYIEKMYPVIGKNTLFLLREVMNESMFASLRKVPGESFLYGMLDRALNARFEPEWGGSPRYAADDQNFDTLMEKIVIFGTFCGFFLNWNLRGEILSEKDYEVCFQLYGMTQKQAEAVAAAASAKGTPDDPDAVYSIAALYTYAFDYILFIFFIRAAAKYEIFLAEDMEQITEELAFMAEKRGVEAKKISLFSMEIDSIL